MFSLKIWAKHYRWELILWGLIAVAVFWFSRMSPYYLNAFQLLYSSRNFVFTGIMALGLMGVIITGEMDLSLPSILAVCTVLLSKASAAQMPLPAAIIMIFIVAACLGALKRIPGCKAQTSLTCGYFGNHGSLSRSCFHNRLGSGIYRF